jgi:hypothetical protein
MKPCWIRFPEQSIGFDFSLARWPMPWASFFGPIPPSICRLRGPIGFGPVHQLILRFGQRLRACFGIRSSPLRRLSKSPRRLRIALFPQLPSLSSPRPVRGGFPKAPALARSV